MRQQKRAIKEIKQRAKAAPERPTKSSIWPVVALGASPCGNDPTRTNARDGEYDPSHANAVASVDDPSHPQRDLALLGELARIAHYTASLKM